MTITSVEVKDEDNEGGKDGVNLHTLTYDLTLSVCSSSSLDNTSTSSSSEPQQSRTVAFGTSGDPKGNPVVLFPPLGAAGNRRMVAAFHDMAHKAGFRVICVNRPGCGTATPAFESTAEAHVSTACHDIVAVLDGLGIEKTEILFMCAGTPFALAFIANHRDRIVEDKPIIGIAAFVPPADCDETKPLFQFGARYSPVAAVSWVLGGVFDNVFSNMLGYLSQEKAIHEITKNLSPVELAALKQQYGSDDADFGEAFYKELSWMISEVGGKSTSSDLKTVLTTYQEYIDTLHQQQPHPEISLFHGEQDKLTCIEAAEWLANEMPYTKMTSLQGGTHEGTLFMLHPELAKIFNKL